MSLWCIIGIIIGYLPFSSIHPFPLSQLGRKKSPSVSGRGLPLLRRALDLTVPGRLLPAPRAVWSLRAVPAVQRRSEAQHHIHPVSHNHVLRGCIRTQLAALGLFVRWREGARSAEEKT